MTELDHLIEAARALGGRKDIAQGSGGNLSLKLTPRDMRVKASGFAFSELSADRGLVPVDYQPITEFYAVAAANPADAGHGAALIMASDGGALRPSMETAFHAFLESAVIHTHPIWTNAIACAEHGEGIAREAFGPDALWLPYRTPGHELALEVYTSARRPMNAGGRMPSTIILQNHGVIASGPDVASALAAHERVVDMAKRYLDQRVGALPAWPAPSWTQHGELWAANNPVLERYAESPKKALDLLALHPFPDSYVFTRDARIAHGLDEAAATEGTVYAVVGQGFAYRASQRRAMEFDEILTASALVRELAGRLGGARYIADDKLPNLASDAEKYRQQIKR